MRRPTSKYRTPPVRSRRELYINPVIKSAKDSRSKDHSAANFDTSRGKIRECVAVFSKQCAAQLPGTVTTDTTQEESLDFLRQAKGIIPDAFEG